MGLFSKRGSNLVSSTINGSVAIIVWWQNEISLGTLDTPSSPHDESKFYVTGIYKTH